VNVSSRSLKALQSGRLNARWVAKYSNWDLSKAKLISLKRCKIGDKLVSQIRSRIMSFRLVAKSVTLNDVERRNGAYFALFYRIL